jgi:hypothetical protein
MPNDKPLSPFQEVHKKIQEARDRIREEQERDELLRQERSETERKAGLRTNEKSSVSRLA